MSNSKVEATFHPGARVPQDVIGILESVIEERDRAMAVFGVQSHPDGTGGPAAEIIRDAQRDHVNRLAENGQSTWKEILFEEVREAFAETDLEALDKELMQVMQVCLVWREHIARRMQRSLLGTTKEEHDDKVSEALAAKDRENGLGSAPSL